MRQTNPLVQGTATRAGPLGELAAMLRQPRVVAVAVLASGGFALVVAVPTDLIDTALFTREIPPTWWAWPALLVSSVLGGLISATYVRPVPHLPVRSPAPDMGDDAPGRGATVAGLLTFFAVGCPVCNKLVLLVLGVTGAVTWFEPFQPVLQAAALALLGWALVRRLRNRNTCRLPSMPTGATMTSTP